VAGDVGEFIEPRDALVVIEGLEGGCAANAGAEEGFDEGGELGAGFVTFGVDEQLEEAAGLGHNDEFL
jgi:hypothetical protein